MTNKQLKNLKDTLWTTADQLRANSGLKSTEYAEPILGLIFLRFADVKYSKFEPEIKAEFDSIKGTRMERPIHEIAIEKCGFYLPEEARYDWLLNLPESEDLAKKVKEAMEAVEKYTAELEDTLPKDIYYSVNSEDDPLVLAKLLKNFKDIPADVEQRLQNGNHVLYDVQYSRYRYMEVADERLKPLVEMIHKYRRGYEQEGYIKEQDNI